MEYFEKNGNVIEKYNVTYDEKQIHDLKRVVIDECSKIVHKEYDGVRGPNQFDYLKIRNYSTKEIGYYSFNDAPDEIKYHFIYDEYEYPYLVELIDKLLDGNSLAVGEIFNPNIIKTLSYSQRIDIMSKEIDEIPNTNINKKQYKLNELKKLMDEAKLNSNQKTEIDYYEVLQQLIHLQLTDTITVDEINRVSEFFDGNVAFQKEKQKVKTYKLK